MPIVSALITLTILIICLLMQFRNYRSKAVLHPSFWFLITWITSVISFLIYLAIGLDFIIYDTSMLDELFTFISFTAICVAILGHLNKHHSDYTVTQWQPWINYSLYVHLSSILLFIAVFYSVFFGGFNLAENRAQMLNLNYAINVAGDTLPISTKIYNVIMSINIPLLILSGYYIGNALNSGQSVKKEYFYPMIIQVLKTINIGGRAGIIYGIIMLTMGVMLGVLRFDIIKVSTLKRVAKYGLLILITFSFFSTYVNMLRAGPDYQKSAGFERWNNYPLLVPFVGVIQYLTDHYPGYQLRRHDSVTEELEMGQITFSGFTMLSVPGSSQLFGSPISIQSIFGLEEQNTVKQSIAVEKVDALWTKATGTIFLPLYDDFGYFGTFVIILLFSIYSQYIFNNMFSKRKTRFISILPFVLVYYLWSQTIFSHHITGNWLSGYLYPFLLLDFIIHITNRRSSRYRLI